jgi:hypothetical protein
MQTRDKERLFVQGAKKNLGYAAALSPLREKALTETRHLEDVEKDSERQDHTQEIALERKVQFEPVL